MSFVFLVSSALKNITLVENVIFELEALLGMILIRVLNLVVKSDRHTCAVLSCANIAVVIRELLQLNFIVRPMSRF